MKRDMDLVCAILLAMEAAPGAYAPYPLIIDGHSDDVVGHHAWLMICGDLITGVVTTTMMGPSPASRSYDDHMEGARVP